MTVHQTELGYIPATVLRPGPFAKRSAILGSASHVVVCGWSGCVSSPDGWRGRTNGRLNREPRSHFDCGCLGDALPKAGIKR